MDRGILQNKNKGAGGDFYRGSSVNLCSIGALKGVWRAKRPPNFARKNLWRECHDDVAWQSLVLSQTRPAKVAEAEPTFGLAISSEKISYMTLSVNMIPYMTLKFFTSLDDTRCNFF
jgi:hypothetical protein